MTQQINAVTIPIPGVKGMARSNSQTVLGPEWCIKAQNCVIDNEGRLAARKGWVKQNASVAESGEPFEQMIEYIKGDGTTAIVSAINEKIYSGTSSLTDITGTITTPSASNWQFINFNGNLYGVQASHTPFVWTGSGTCANLTAASGSLPTGNCGVGAFGRLWVCDSDKQTIKYSALLDATLWDTADGAGVIDMTSVWTQGMDEVVGITSYGSSLVVFGKRHIVFWVDGSGSEIGINPTNIYVNQVIENVGLVARDAFCLVGELDVVFWSWSGIRSVRRTIQEMATPVNEISSRNRQYINEYLDTGTLASVRMAYSAQEGLVLLSHPTADRFWAFDTRYPMEDGDLRTFEWTIYPTALCPRADNTLLLGMDNGYIGLYSEYDDNDVAYRFIYSGGWFPLNPEPGLKMLKRAKVAVASRVDVVGSFKWWTDFKNNMKGLQRTWEPPGGSLYNYQPDQFNYTALYSGGGGVIDKYLPLSKSCQYMRFGFEVEINGFPFALQYVTILFEPTRYA